MNSANASTARIRPDGKFFRKGREKFFVRGVTYGPLAPDEEGRPFASRDVTARDLHQITALGANVVRLYTPPPEWLPDLAGEFGLALWVDLVWPHHLCFDTRETRAAIRRQLRETVRPLAGHPAIFAWNIANEIPPDIVRWIGPARVRRFLEELVETVKDVDPQALCSYANFPPTEYLQPRNLDFVAFNVYLHDRRAFRNYLARLQILAEDRPLVLAECGVDALREGPQRQAELLEWQIEEAFRAGLAGITIFSFTDDWHRGGAPVLDWAMGLTTADRTPKPAWHTVQRQFHRAPRFPLPRYPRVSVVVAGYNGGRTLPDCLESLQQLRYPDYEVILVDDGSTDDTPAIAARFPAVRLLRHEQNLGLSAARNTGIAAATGEIVAFTDADCRADEDWLYHLVSALLESEAVGVGGPNLLPPDDSPLAAAVMASPGGPAAVLLTDRLAEHIPGCNMAFYKWALESVGGFDPVFRKAGDDVDICWRLLQAGHTLVYAPAAVVWHYRRSTAAAYLRQQAGYGEAEALLFRKHPEQFNRWGGSRWRGRIYGAGYPPLHLAPPIIYHGPFGTGWFQTLYTPPPAGWLLLTTALEFHVLVTLPLGLLGIPYPGLRWLAAAALATSLGTCVLAASRAPLPAARARWWSRPLIALLYLLQPIARGRARYRGRLPGRVRTAAAADSLEAVGLRRSPVRLDRIDLWSERPVDRPGLLQSLMAWLQARGWSPRPDTGWCPFDFEVARPPWVLIRVVSALEVYPGGKRRFLLKLNAVPSLGAWLSAGFMVLVGAVLAGLVRAPGVVTAAMCLLVALLAWGGFRVQARRARSQLAVAVDEFARAHGLVRLPWIGQRRWFQGLVSLIRRLWSPNPTRTAVPADSPFAPPGRSADRASSDGPVEPNKSG
ncbi:glycosyltransferase [Limisphaera ngatamarikiensis]|uniref:Glycosyltransferase n=1 Tax=Limisphaera ngatamarikiensis TaxID=1324935 RepID=A0A6M1RWD9_9BACT|nr:glycosyltransferase [Limisphaera ngatamarikiensis]NGO39741.1 glycosyltransferase [Limisphaera ngatamarikiensis]